MVISNGHVDQQATEKSIAIQLVTESRALNPASAEDYETVGCFFDFHEIKDSPKKTQKPEMERQVSILAPQSASRNALEMKYSN